MTLLGNASSGPDQHFRGIEVEFLGVNHLQWAGASCRTLCGDGDSVDFVGGEFVAMLEIFKIQLRNPLLAESPYSMSPEEEKASSSGLVL